MVQAGGSPGRGPLLLRATVGDDAGVGSVRAISIEAKSQRNRLAGSSSKF